MINRLTVGDVKAFEVMLKECGKSAEKLKKDTDELSHLIIDYINNKFKKPVITYNPEKEVFSIIDEKEKVLEVLKNLGLVKNI